MVEQAMGQAVSPGSANSNGTGSAHRRLRQKAGKERVQHAPIRILGTYPLRELLPARAVGRFDMLPLNEGALIQERDAAAAGGKFVELLQEVVPRVNIGGRVNGIDGEDLLVLSVGEERAAVAADVVGAEGHIAAESRGCEMPVGEIEIRA